MDEDFDGRVERCMDVFEGRLRSAVERSGMTMHELAGATGIPYTTVCYYLRGERNATKLNLTRMCVALGVSADYLMGLTEAIA